MTDALRDAAEALYKLRRVLSEKKIVNQHRSWLKDAETGMEGAIRLLGEDPGATAADADNLKLRMMRSRGASITVTHVEGESFDDILEDVANHISHSSVIWRELGRFNEFCTRWVYHGLEMVRDDPDMPVKPWMDAWMLKHDGYPVSLREWAIAYREWTRQVCDKYHADHMPTLEQWPG